MDDVCEFCNRFLDADEELEPVFLGENPSYATVEAEESVEKRMLSAGYESHDGNAHVLGYPVDQVQAIIQTLKKSDMFHVETFDTVVEAQMEPLYELGSKEPKEEVSMEHEVNDDKVSARIVVEPPKLEREPDLEVCPHCMESLGNVSN